MSMEGIGLPRGSRKNRAAEAASPSKCTGGCAIFPFMEIRAAQLADLDHLLDLDGTIESGDYLHVERAAGEGLAVGWRLEERPLREKRIDANAVGDDERFMLKQLLE